MKNLDNKPQLSDLRAVLALMEDGTVTRASARLGVTQSTFSYQLERMRKRFSDPLFVRVGNRMAPTPFALRLAEPAKRVLRIVDTEITDLASFDPRVSDREFRIGVNEIGAITLVPKLMRRLNQEAPRARLVQMHVDTRTMAAMLEAGEMDIAAGYFAQSDNNLMQQLLYKRDYVCVVRRDHPRIGASLSLRQLSQEQQLQSPLVPATNAWVTDQLVKAGFASGSASGTAMTTQHVAAIPFIVAASDLVAILPREVCLLFSPVAPIKVVRLPRAIPPLAIHQYWHPRVASDPAVKFFRDLIYSCAHEE